MPSYEIIMMADCGIQDKKYPVGSSEKLKNLIHQSRSEQKDIGPMEEGNPHFANIE